jgi:L-alanine-DL-glutamate epimerase-like enolase superfamily enzyme
VSRHFVAFYGFLKKCQDEFFYPKKGNTVNSYRLVYNFIMKIASFETYSNRTISFVRLRTDEGVEGWGQMSPYNADISTAVFHRQVAPHVLGKDPQDLETLLDCIIEDEYKFPGSYLCRALCGLDTAVWDLRGKIAGKPVSQLIGGSACSFPVYGSSMRRDITPQAEAERLASLRELYGYQAFKIRVGKVNGHDQDEWPGRTEALLAQVRQAVGPAVRLLADGNGCFTPQRAIQVGRLMEDLDYVHFEEPCPYWELEWTAEVAVALQIDIAGGEQDWDINQWKRIIRQHAVDIVQPDIGYIGGLSRALRVAKMAEEAGRWCVPHSANLSLITVFTLHMMTAIPNAGPYVEYSIEPTPWAENLFQPALEVQHGSVTIPPGPGWGVEINPDWLKKAESMLSTL